MRGKQGDADEGVTADQIGGGLVGTPLPAEDLHTQVPCNIQAVLKCTARLETPDP